MDYPDILGLQCCNDSCLDHEYQGHQTVADILEIPAAGYYDHTFCAVRKEEG